MTRDELNRLYNKFYGTKHRNAVVTNQRNVRCKSSKKTVLFTDEFSRAENDVHNACLQLILEKKLHSHILPYVDGQRTFIIAGDNPDNGDYNVNPLDPAALDRFLSVSIEVDPESWLDWARENNVNKIIRAFIADNMSKLHFVPEEGEMSDNISATPRSWTKLGTYLDKFQDTDVSLHYPIISGKIGKALAAQFLNFYSNYENIISIDDIEELTNNLLEKTKDVEKIGKAIKELTKDSEAVQLTEITLGLISKYINKDVDEVYPMMGMLYGLNIEILVTIFKKISTENAKAYKKLVELDTKMNNKLLFIRAAESIVI